MARQSYDPSKTDRDKVKAMSGMGMRQEDIARIFGIDLKTLRKHYRDELDDGIALANYEVAKTLYDKARKGDTTSIIFWLKTRAKWRETDDAKQDQEPQPVTINFSVNPDIGDTSITIGEKRGS